MNRRGFLQAILAAGVAPAVIRSGVLMPVRSFLIPSRDFEIGSYENIRWAGELDPVNFVLMRSLLQAARKRLPYFNGAPPAYPNEDRIGWQRIEPAFNISEVSMSYAG